MVSTSLPGSLFFYKLTLVILHIYFFTYILASACHEKQKQKQKKPPVGILSGIALKGEITSLGYRFFASINMVSVSI